MKRGLLIFLATMLVLAGCGGSSHTNTVTRAVAAAPAPAKAAAQLLSPPAVPRTQDQVKCPPPPGLGKMGVCAPKPVQVYPDLLVPSLISIPGPKIPDVSSWQGNVNWYAVRAWQQQHGWKPAGIFKMGEYVVDPFAARNNSELVRLGMWHAGYWFVRKTGCLTEAGQIVTEARALHLLIVVLDDEVPEAAGYDGCLTPRLKAAGLIVLEYASPGAYPGGNGGPGNLSWIAAYGPFNAPASPWGTRVVAFQCTDGTFGCVTDVPGIGKDDVNIDMGITSIGAGPPPDPYSKYPTAVVKGFDVSEHRAVQLWDRLRCKVPRHGPGGPRCHHLQVDLHLMLGRIDFLAHNAFVHGRWVVLKRARWEAFNAKQPLGGRRAGIVGRGIR